MAEWVYFLIFPSVGALVGWFTNWLAIRMLFRPRRPVRILCFTLQGVIPRRHADLAGRVAETVESSLLTQEDLEAAMTGVRWEDEVRRLIARILDEKGPGIFLVMIPGIAQAWSNVVIPTLQDVLGKEINRLIVRSQSAVINKLRTSVDVKGIVRDKVEQFEVEALEGLIRGIARTEFGHIQVVGALTGAAIGIVQGLILLFTT
ncbi:MAG: DUF445 family protein [bacterium]|nr:MAG: DUF445 family protein [bacterium]